MKLGYVAFYVKNVAASVTFWEQAFGLVCRFSHESGQYAEMETGETTLSFASIALGGDHGLDLREHSAGKPAAACEVAFVTEDIEAAWAQALKAGGTPASPPSAKPWGQTVAWLRDPDGILVELCTPAPSGD